VSDSELNSQVENELTKLRPIITNSLVNQAVIRALISTHPDPSRVKQVAESLLMQAQATLALSDLQRPQLLSTDVQVILDSMFQPPKHLG
jgi:hypothetical protein